MSQQTLTTKLITQSSCENIHAQQESVNEAAARVRAAQVFHTHTHTHTHACTPVRIDSRLHCAIRSAFLAPAHALLRAHGMCDTCSLRVCAHAGVPDAIGRDLRTWRHMLAHWVVLLGRYCLEVRVLAAEVATGAAAGTAEALQKPQPYEPQQQAAVKLAGLGLPRHGL
jgi:hypothetical protein